MLDMTVIDMLEENGDPLSAARPIVHWAYFKELADRDKFADWYQETLTSYQHLFNQKPSRDIWPEAEVRFGQDIHWQRVNVSQHCIIRKTQVRALAFPAVSALLIILLLVI